METPDALKELLSMSIPDRIRAVHADLESDKQKYATIEPHDLAEALGIEDSRSLEGWSQTHAVEKMTLEQHAERIEPQSEFVNHLEEHVTKVRFKKLLPLFEALDDQDVRNFDFLTKKERRILEDALDHENLQSYMDNGIGGIALYTITQDDIDLNFQGEVEDTGECVNLRTPYHERRGEFTDLSNCVDADFF